MSHPEYVIGMDLEAGRGARIGLFDHTRTLLDEWLLEQEQFAATAEAFAEQLQGKCLGLLDHHSLAVDTIRAIGIATPGLLNHDGSYRLASNLPFLAGANLQQLLAERLGLPVGIENNASAGGLAEWSVLRNEVLYWVFGRGWGGAWISREGEVRFPALDWDGQDHNLHYTAEPGYAIPLDKIGLKMLFVEVGASYERFESILEEEADEREDILLGPDGDPDHLRAEVILSGPGRGRLFRTIAGNDDFFERFLEIHEAGEIGDYMKAGPHISKLSSMRVEAAINTDRLFGKVLAQATRTMLKQARKDGLADGAPICLGGKPSYALPYFGPSAQRAIGRMGYMNYLRPSVLDDRGLNANLVGAAIVAERAAESV